MRQRTRPLPRFIRKPPFAPQGHTKPEQVNNVQLLLVWRRATTCHVGKEIFLYARACAASNAWKLSFILPHAVRPWPLASETMRSQVKRAAHGQRTRCPSTCNRRSTSRRPCCVAHEGIHCVAHESMLFRWPHQKLPGITYRKHATPSAFAAVVHKCRRGCWTSSGALNPKGQPRNHKKL